MVTRINCMEEYKVLDKIGSGTFSEVYKVYHRTTHRYFAMKTLHKVLRTREELTKEDEIPAMLYIGKHPKIISLHDAIYTTETGKLSLFLDLMDTNPLILMEKQKRPFSERETLRLVQQLLEALKFLHEKNVLHRDIKPENLMINDRTLELKLGDFGSCCLKKGNSPLTEYIATRWYRPPECLLGYSTYDGGIDLWAVGAIMYELLTRLPLFPGTDGIDQLNKIHSVTGTPTADELHEFLPPNSPSRLLSLEQHPPKKLENMLPSVTKDTIDLMYGLLTYNPKKRLTAEAALAHPAFTRKTAERRHTVIATSPLLNIPKTKPPSRKGPKPMFTKKPREDADIYRRILRPTKAKNIIRQPMRPKNVFLHITKL